MSKFRRSLARSYLAWRIYHVLVADAVSIQRPTKFKIVRDFLGDQLGIVADIGCGPGVFTRYLSARARQVLSADIDLESLKRVKARHQKLENTSFLTVDADRLPFPDECLNTLLLLEVLEHLTDDAAALREMCRVLRPGGKIVLSVPVPPGEINEGSPWGHKREGYRLPEIVALLAQNGFRVDKHAFAEFKFSRHAARLIRGWRMAVHLPAPIFLSWVAYIDLLLDEHKTQMGDHLPASVLIQARKTE